MFVFVCGFVIVVNSVAFGLVGSVVCIDIRVQPTRSTRSRVCRSVRVHVDDGPGPGRPILRRREAPPDAYCAAAQTYRPAPGPGLRNTCVSPCPFM